MIKLDKHSNIVLRSGATLDVPRNPESRNVGSVMIEGLDELGFKYNERYGFDERYAIFASAQPGYSSGRYTLYVRKLQRAYKGNRYHVVLVWTPYAFDVQFNGYVNSFEELKTVIGDVNPKLLNGMNPHTRAYYETQK